MEQGLGPIDARSSSCHLSVRAADALTDAGPCTEIYGHYVRHSTATFEYDAPSDSEMSERIASSVATHEWLVSERQGEVTGFAYASPWNPRPAYAWSCETTIYLRPGVEGGGVGTTLYRALLDRLRTRRFHLAIGRIALPNAASMRLHESCGFAEVGVHRNLGYKQGQWIDVLHTALQLLPAVGEPLPVVPLSK